MEEQNLRQVLSDLPLSGLRYFERTGSTNDDALVWAAEGAPDLALVYAEQQTAGRGRGSRTWFTPPGAALAFSLVLRGQPSEPQVTPLLSMLGALAVCEALEELSLAPQVKWPNDVLLSGRKVCGTLAESTWLGDRVEHSVLGIGMNVHTGSVPHAEDLIFPATCLEAEIPSMTHPSQRLNRAHLLRQILQSLLGWRPRLTEAEFIQALEKRLALRGEEVEIHSTDGQVLFAGRVDGLERDGSLRLLTPQGTLTVAFGEVHLHPLV